MRSGAVSMLDIRRESHRLTGSFHLAEDQQAMKLLNRVKVCSRLVDLTCGRKVFRGPIFKRLLIEDARYGKPYVSAKDLVQSEIRTSEFLSQRHGALLDELELHEGMILVTCSGMNLGTAIWTRADMEGLCASHDLIRIEPDSKQVPPGYLHAFLASRFGRVAIRRQIYGGSIKHVEPRQVAELQIPRLDHGLELQVDALTKQASQLRSAATSELEALITRLPRTLGLTQLREHGVSGFGTGAILASKLEGRLDAPYHSSAAREVDRQLADCTTDVRPLPDVLRRHFKPPLFKRLWVDDPQYGPQFVSGNDAYRSHAEEPRYVSRRSPNADDFLLHRGWVAFQAAGQIYGLFGHPLFVCGWLEGVFCADDIYRLVPWTETDGGYLYAFLCTPHGQILIKRQACGNSIPRVWDPHMRKVRVPWPSPEVRKSVGRKVIEAHEARERARLLELEALNLVEQAIEVA